MFMRSFKKVFFNEIEEYCNCDNRMQFNYYDKKFKMQQFSLKNNRKICKLNQ